MPVVFMHAIHEVTNKAGTFLAMFDAYGVHPVVRRSELGSEIIRGAGMRPGSVVAYIFYKRVAGMQSVLPG